MPRALFEKTGTSVWISHLDTMRLFQRAFKRAGLNLNHTQGFNPRPSVSIALPLSVGVQSHCELLDFDLEGDTVTCGEIRDRLNGTLIDGVRVLDVYEGGRKLRELALLDTVVTLKYDGGIPEGAAQKIAELFRRETLTVEKKGKSGTQDQDIIPMIRRLTVEAADGNTVALRALVCCQNPTLNPMQLSAAVEKYLPACRPDFAECVRMELYDNSEEIFR